MDFHVILRLWWVKVKSLQVAVAKIVIFRHTMCCQHLIELFALENEDVLSYLENITLLCLDMQNKQTLWREIEIGIRLRKYEIYVI